MSGSTALDGVWKNEQPWIEQDLISIRNKKQLCSQQDRIGQILILQADEKKYLSDGYAYIPVVSPLWSQSHSEESSTRHLDHGTLIHITWYSHSLMALVDGGWEFVLTVEEYEVLRQHEVAVAGLTDANSLSSVQASIQAKLISIVEDNDDAAISSEGSHCLSQLLNVIANTNNDQPSQSTTSDSSKFTSVMLYENFKTRSSSCQPLESDFVNKPSLQAQTGVKSCSESKQLSDAADGDSARHPQIPDMALNSLCSNSDCCEYGKQRHTVAESHQETHCSFQPLPLNMEQSYIKGEDISEVWTHKQLTSAKLPEIQVTNPHEIGSGHTCGGKLDDHFSEAHAFSAKAKKKFSGNSLMPADTTTCTSVEDTENSGDAVFNTHQNRLKNKTKKKCKVSAFSSEKREKLKTKRSHKHLELKKYESIPHLQCYGSKTDSFIPKDKELTPKKNKGARKALNNYSTSGNWPAVDLKNLFVSDSQLEQMDKVPGWSGSFSLPRKTNGQDITTPLQLSKNSQSSDLFSGQMSESLQCPVLEKHDISNDNNREGCDDEDSGDLFSTLSPLKTPYKERFMLVDNCLRTKLTLIVQEVEKEEAEKDFQCQLAQNMSKSASRLTYSKTDQSLPSATTNGELLHDISQPVYNDEEHEHCIKIRSSCINRSKIKDGRSKNKQGKHNKKQSVDQLHGAKIKKEKHKNKKKRSTRPVCDGENNPLPQHCIQITHIDENEVVEIRKLEDSEKFPSEKNLSLLVGFIIKR